MALLLVPLTGAVGDLVELATPAGNTPTRCVLAEIAAGPVGPAGQTGPAGPEGPAGSSQITGADFRAVGVDWPVTAAAPAVADSVTPMMLTRRFSGVVEQGVGFDLLIPAFASAMTIAILWRAQTAPAVPAAVQPALYRRQILDNAPVPPWSPALLLDPLAVPLNNWWQYSAQTLALATLGLVGGLSAFFELTRQPASPGDTLAGGWILYRIAVFFS